VSGSGIVLLLGPVAISNKKWKDGPMALNRTVLARERCGQFALSLVASLAALVPIAASQAQHIEDGKLVFPERRIAAATYQGADEEVVRATALKITTREGDAPGSWVYEWRTIGEYYEQIGAEEIEAGHRVDAREAYIRASVYYALAWFPGNYTPEERLAYGQQLSVYRKAGALFDAPLEVVNVPFRESHLITYVHRPAGIEKPPLIIWTGGSDQYKANYYRPIQALNSKGFAVVTFDLPGFGESQAWPSEPTADEAHIAVMEYFIARGDFAAERISFVGVSWGGYFATRVAARNDPRVSAVVAFCAPVHNIFSAPVDFFQEALDSPERMTFVNLARHLQIEATAETMQATLERFSLRDAGSLGQGQSITTPLLVINGTLDGIAPVSDLMLTHESAVDSDLWLLGRGDHCAIEYWPVVIPQVADWLIEKTSR
jgi:pimeloyl-ACP methyl ester carboxylesterase